MALLHSIGTRKYLWSLKWKGFPNKKGQEKGYIVHIQLFEVKGMNSCDEGTWRGTSWGEVKVAE